MPFRITHPYLLLTLTTLFWSCNMIVARAAREDLPPMALAFWRWVITFLLILPFALPHLKSQWPLLRQNWKRILVLGILGVSGYNTLAYVALQYTTATNTNLLNSFIPIATMALSWAFLGKRLRPLEALGVILSLIGVSTIVLRGDLSTLASMSLNLGDLWMLGAILVWALYTIGLQWRPAGLNAMLMLAAFTVVGTAFLVPLYAWEINSGRVIHLNWGSFAALLYVGIFPSFLGFVFYNRAVAEVGASTGSLFIHLMPVFGTVLAALFLNEMPQWFHYAGIALIFTGIGLTSLMSVKRASTTLPKPGT